MQVYGHQVWNSYYSSLSYNRLGKCWFLRHGGNCGDPPPGWPPGPQKAPCRPSSHWPGQAPFLSTQNLLDQGPLIKWRKAAYLSIVQSIVSAGASAADPKSLHIVNLVQLGFYFCLSSCKYTKCAGHRRTFQLRPLLDIVFFAEYQLLPTDTPVDKIQYAT